MQLIISPFASFKYNPLLNKFASSVLLYKRLVCIFYRTSELTLLVLFLKYRKLVATSKKAGVK